MIIFSKIRWKNILSTGNRFTEINLNSHDTTLIVGKNGSGKSTLLDALCLGLFGKPFRKTNKPNLLNSINQKDGVVEIEFSSGEKQYKVKRGIKPNIFEIYCDGELINQDSTNIDYQEYLEKYIIKYNFKSFTQIVILGSASFVPFMQLKASDRRIIIEDLLDIQIFSSMNSLVKDKLVINRDAINATELLIESCKQKIQMQKKFISEMNENNESVINSYQTEYDSNIADIEKLHDLIKSKNDQIEELKVILQKKDDVDKKLKKYSDLEFKVESILTKSKKEKLFFEKNDNCPTCRQSINESFKQSQLSSLNTKINDAENDLKIIEEKIISAKEKAKKFVELSDKINSINLEIIRYTTSISELNKSNKKIIQQIKTLRETQNDKKENVVLEDFNVEFKTRENERHQLLEDRKYLEIASMMLKDTGIKTKIIKQYLPLINKLVNKYLSDMNFFVNFNLDENFKETIKSRHRDEFNYESFSEGEKSKIDVALMLTWRMVAKMKNSVNTNLLIMDEIFDGSLDNDGIESLTNILHTLENVNVFIISHKTDQLIDRFNNIIKIEKSNNFSRVVTNS